MKISVAQTKPIKGDIQRNIINHKKLIELAVSSNAEIIIFPELSITGYEPELAKELATDKNDSRFNEFQIISDSKHIITGTGMPLKSDTGVTISMIIFQPDKPRQTYSKQYLHPDEYPYFVIGQNKEVLTGLRNRIAIAICYELSVPEHSENAHKHGKEIYIASVAKSVTGVEKAIKDLSEIATKYSMTVLLSNCVGVCDNVLCGGKTSAWNSKGILLGQLNDTNEGILIINTDTDEITEQLLRD